jgi:predicted MPP superfamily phosphohydrolase
MRLTILHLSDIHFREDRNPISSRVRAIASALSSVSPRPEAVLTIISGDVAYSGKPEEYHAAKKFLSELEAEIRRLDEHLEYEMVSVPGNHDCYLPEAATTLRRALVGGIEPTLQTHRPDREIVNQLLAAQLSYFTFQDDVTSSRTDFDDRLCKTELVVLKEARIQVNLYNTALLSQRSEIQGTLRVPTAIFDSKIQSAPDAALSIAVLHHSHAWFESENGLQFRRHLDDSADLILSGHQHFDHAYIKQNLEGQRTLCLEGSALQTDAYSSNSGFNIIELDVTERKHRVVHCEWKKDHYRATGTQEWSAFVGNRAFRHEFRVSDEFRKFLADPGAGYSHSRKREISLRDIFVYPDLTVRRMAVKARPKEILPEQFHGFIRNSSHLIFEGPPQSGRTALAKITFSDLLDSLGYVPVFIEGRDLKAGSERAFANRINKAVSHQYSADLVEKFGLFDPARRALILDDWHKAELNSKARTEFLSLAYKMFGKIFLFSDPTFDVQEFVTRAKDQSSILQFQSASLSQFGHRARGRLIEKWLFIGREQTHDRKDLTREIDEIENTVVTLLGKNTLPKFPFIVLSVLQAHQEKKTTRAEAGSYGYVYEVLITTALGTTAKSPSDIDKKYTFLSLLAYRMFKSGTETLPHTEIVSICEDYFRLYGLKMASDGMLEDLIGARILALSDGNYRFFYSYYFEYFVARYYKDAFQNPTENTRALAEELSEITDHINLDQYAKILMFFLYFTKNESVITQLMNNAAQVFARYSAATFESDIEFANSLYKAAPELELPGGSVQENRDERRKAQDEAEKKLPTPSEGKKIKYSEDLDDGEKLHIASKYLELLGQILRNFPGSLKAKAKLEIAQCTYLLGLRMAAAILDMLRKAVAFYRELLRNALDQQSQELKQARSSEDNRSEAKPATTVASDFKEIGEQADQLFLVLTRLCVLCTIKNISFNVGSPELDQTYSDVLQSLDDSIAVKMVNLSIRLDHFRGFPEDKVSEILKEVKKSVFARHVLADMVIGHFTFFEVDHRIRQRVLNELGIMPAGSKIIDSRPKLLTESQEDAIYASGDD